MVSNDPIVYVVDDDLAVREALSSVIRSVNLRVATFASAEEFLLHTRPDVPSCLVLDVQLPEISGFDLLRTLEEAVALMPVIFITGYGTIPMGVRAMKAGALEFLTKPFQEADLFAAIAQALERSRAASVDRADLASVQQRLAKLTPREREVLALVVAGRMNKQIAAELGAAEQTIKQHRGRIMQKVGAGSVAELVRLVERAAGRSGAAVPARSKPGPEARSGHEAAVLPK